MQLGRKTFSPFRGLNLPSKPRSNIWLFSLLLLQGEANSHTCKRFSMIYINQFYFCAPSPTFLTFIVIYVPSVPKIHDHFPHCSKKLLIAPSSIKHKPISLNKILFSWSNTGILMPVQRRRRWRRRGFDEAEKIRFSFHKICLCTSWFFLSLLFTYLSVLLLSVVFLSPSHILFLAYIVLLMHMPHIWHRMMNTTTYIWPTSTQKPQFSTRFCIKMMLLFTSLKL